MIKDIYPDENVITIFGQQYEIGNNKMKKNILLLFAILWYFCGFNLIPNILGSFTLTLVCHSVIFV